MLISHKDLSLQCFHSGDIGMDIIVQEYSGLRKNYNLISKPYNIWRGMSERVHYQKNTTLLLDNSKHTWSSEDRQDISLLFHWALLLYNLSLGVSLEGNLENHFHFALLIEAMEICYLFCSGRVIGDHNFI